MGCENSKAVRIQPGGPAANRPASDCTDNTAEVMGKEEGTQTPQVKHKQLIDGTFATEYDVDEHGNKIKSGRRRSRSPDNKDDSGADSPQNTDRVFSATSKKSTDSGLGEDGKNSGDSEVNEEEKLFKPRDNLPKGLTRRKAAQAQAQAAKNDSKEDSRTRVEESQIMQRLQEEGLIANPQLQASGGMRFDIVAATPCGDGGVKAPGGVGIGVPKPPPRLEKLALERRQKKKKRVLTEEDIREKLEVAERRRKRREEERLAKLKERERTDAVAALESFMQYQKNKEDSLSQRMDQVHDNRERKLQELKEKQERRKKHAEEVRKRRAQAAQNAPNEASQQDQSAFVMMTPRPEMTTTPEGAVPSGRILQVEGAKNITDSVRILG